MSVSPEKVATPWLAVAESVPPSVAPPGLLASASVNAVVVARLDVAVGVLDRRLQAETAAGGDAGRGLLGDRHLRRRRGGHGDGGVVTPRRGRWR